MPGLAPAPPEQLERRALTASLIATAVLGAVAIVWGIASGARVVIFDGIYQLAGIVLVASSMLAARTAASPPSTDYPFGRHAATPLAVALQGAALLATLAYGAVDAVTVILAGGSAAAGISVLAYGVVSAAGAFAVIVLLRRAARTSPLAHAEVVSWRAGLYLSLGVAIGGAVALWLAAAGQGRAAGYIDPVLVLLACAGITPMALALTRDGVRELLEAAPSAELRGRIDQAVGDAVRDVAGSSTRSSLPDPVVRATKLGHRLYVEVDFVVAGGRWSVDEEDVVRRAVTARLDALDLEVWATVALTTDPALAAD